MNLRSEIKPRSLHWHVHRQEDRVSCTELTVS